MHDAGVWDWDGRMFTNPVTIVMLQGLGAGSAIRRTTATGYRHQPRGVLGLARQTRIGRPQIGTAADDRDVTLGSGHAVDADLDGLVRRLVAGGHTITGSPTTGHASSRRR